MRFSEFSFSLFLKCSGRKRSVLVRVRASAGVLIGYFAVSSLAWWLGFSSCSWVALVWKIALPGVFQAVSQGDGARSWKFVEML